MSANKDFLPSSSPVSSICAIEIIAILFLFVMNCYKSSFQECITTIVLKDDRTTNQPPCCLLQLQEKVSFHLPRSGCLGTPVTLTQSLYGRTDGRTYADVRTKIFRINGCSASSAIIQASKVTFYRDHVTWLTWRDVNIRRDVGLTITPFSLNGVF